MERYFCDSVFLFKGNNMRKKIAVYFGPANLGYYSKIRMNLNTQFLSMNDDNDYYLISMLDPKKIKNLVDFSRFKEIVDCTSYSLATDWTVRFKKLDKIQNEYNFDKMIMVFTPLVEQFGYGCESNIKKLYEKCVERPIFSYNFMAMNRFYSRIFLPYHFMTKHNLPITQIVYDPLEPDFSVFNENNNRYMFYDSPSANGEYFPFVEWSFMFNNPKKQLFKKYDFVFGMSSIMILNDFRHQVVGELLDLQKAFKKNNINYALYFRDKFRNINTFLTDGTYNDRIAEAKFTLMIPSYDVQQFSIIRFYDAIDRQCIPLVYDNCALDEAFANKPNLLKIIKKYLLVNTSNLLEKLTTLDYDMIIKKLYDCAEIKELYTREYYQKQLKHNNGKIFTKSTKLINSKTHDIFTKTLSVLNTDKSFTFNAAVVLNKLRKIYNKDDLLLNFRTFQMAPVDFYSGVPYIPFIYTKDYNWDKRERFEELWDICVNQYTSDFAFGNGSIDDNSIMVIDYEPDVNIKIINKVGVSQFPALYLEKYAEYLRIGSHPITQYTYFTNVIKKNFFEDNMTKKEYNKLYTFSIRLLKQEIKIINPKLIFTIGEKTKNSLQMLNLNFPIINLRHPSDFLQDDKELIFKYYQNKFREIEM